MDQKKQDPFIIAEFISKQFLDTNGKENEAFLKSWIEENEENRKIWDSFKDKSAIRKDLIYIASLDVDAAWNKVENRLNIKNRLNKEGNRNRKKNVFSRPWLAYAASVLLVCISLFFIFKMGKKDPGVIPDLTHQYKNDVMPGSGVVKLLLSNGKTVDLNHNQELKEEHHIIEEKNGTAIEVNEGYLDYMGKMGTSAASTAEVIYNTLVVPKAASYQINLSDGTKIWMNALSELKFPVNFDSKERKIYLKGEAYLEVSKDPSRPFKVVTDGSEVEVLGTHFNVNAYKQGALTTLFEGKVKVINGAANEILKPGQQAAVIGSQIIVKPADLARASAWRNGEFYFKKDKIAYVMEQLSLWYNLKIVFKGEIPEAEFTGRINRNVKLSEALEAVKEVSAANFDIEGRTLYISYK